MIIQLLILQVGVMCSAAILTAVGIKIAYKARNKIQSKKQEEELLLLR